MRDQQQGQAGRSAAAYVLIGLGVLFLLAQLGIFSLSLFGVLWPFFVILPGLVFLYFAYTGSKDLAALAIPGAIVTGTGGILLYQSVTNHWESWAYIWTLYPVFLGLGLMFMGRRADNDSTYNTGRSFVNWGLIGLLVFGGLFEIFIFGGFSVGRYLLPAALILIGVWMLLRGSGRIPSKGRSRPKRRLALDDDPIFTGAPVMGSRSPRAPSASEQLRRDIEAALAEEPAAPADVPAEPAPTGDPEA